MKQPKGGDVVLAKSIGGLFVRLHTRSQNYRPIHYTGNTDKFLRIERDEVDSLVIIDEVNTPFIDAVNAFDQIRAAVRQIKGKGLVVESVDVPEVSMDRSASILLVAVNVSPPKVVAASQDASLKVLFDKTAQTINASSNVAAKPLIEPALQVAPAPAPIPALRM